jgi:hypothetical protein
MDVDAVEALRRFVLERLDQDEQRAEQGELPFLDQAERRGRLRIVRAHEGGLLLLASAYDTHHGWQEEWRTT